MNIKKLPKFHYLRSAKFSPSAIDNFSLFKSPAASCGASNLDLKTKRGQVTIFIILALILIFIIIYILINKPDITSIFKVQSPIDQISECVETALNDGADILSKQGGMIEPDNYFLYQDNKVGYVCYNREDYKPCVMQTPLLIQSVAEELRKYSEPKIKQCIESMGSTLAKKGQTVNFKDPIVDIELLPNNVIATIELDLQIRGPDSTESYKSIKTDVNSKLYEFAAVASSIANDDARIGDSETLTYMIVEHPWLKLEKKKQSDGTKIYILSERGSENKFWFATRSYALPPGAVM